MIIIIERYLDYEFIDNNIEYFYIAMTLLLTLFVFQGAASIYYCITRGGHISHGFNLVS